MAGINSVVLGDYLGFDGSPDSWNWKEDFVQLDEALDTGANFIAAESTLIAAGTAKLAVGAMNVVKVGLAPSIQISQQIPQQRLYEIGSMRCHILNGIPVGGLSINRLIYNGPSLARALYAKIVLDDNTFSADAITGMSTLANNAQSTMLQGWNSINERRDKVMDFHGKTNQWLSMWDTRFRAPFGLAIFMQDIKGNAVGGLYFEGCKIGNHQFSQSAGQLIMLEGMSVMFDRSVPIIAGIGARF